MKLVTFDAGRVGYVDGDDEQSTVVELDCGSTREFFERGGVGAGIPETGERLALADVRLRAPIVPKKFFHTAGNFAAHHEELRAVDWSHPVHKGIVFFQNVDAIIGPDDAIVYPEGLTRELDYELELAVVIGRSGTFFGRIGASSVTSAYARRSPVSATCPPRSKYSRVEGTSSSMTVPSSSSRRPTRPPSKVMSFMSLSPRSR